MGIERLRFSFVIPNRLAGMSWPENVRPLGDAVNYLKEQGVTLLVNTTSGGYGTPVLSEQFSVIHTPVANMTAPTVEQMDTIYHRYSTMNEAEVMAVHCVHGLGRTGLVLACLLGRSQGLGPEEAIREMRRLRPGSIESEEQEGFVRGYLN